MSKTVLTLDDINLLKNSEEPKNKELYGNLYEVLCSLQNPKAVTLEQLANLDDEAIAALTYNKRTLVDTVIKEWYAERVSKEDPAKKVKCGLCNTPNKYLYYIRNRKNDKVLNVGSHCITKFPGLEGYIEQKKQLKQIQRSQKIVARRNIFYKHFPNCEGYMSNANEYFINLPVLLPYDLYYKLKDNITRMRLIYNKYVEEDRKPFKSELSSMELFRLAIDQFEILKAQADLFVLENAKTPMICKRREINWLISEKKENILQQICENDGIYSLSTLKNIYLYDFVIEYEELFKLKNQSNLFRLEKIDNNNVIFTFNKRGYQPPIVFLVTLKDFMKIIGANCILDADYTYSGKDILSATNIYYSKRNLESVLDYIYNIIDRFNCAFLMDETTNALILYRKGDRSIRKFSPNKFLIAYSKYILSSDEAIKNYLLALVKSKDVSKWITLENQILQGIDDKIARLYKEHCESHLYNNSYNRKQVEMMLYSTMHNSITGKTIINFNEPEYIKIPISNFNIRSGNIGYVNYGIRVSDDSLEPVYHKGNIILVQDVQRVKDGELIFFVDRDGIDIQRCYVRGEYENLLQYIGRKKSKLQAYGKIIHCLDKL